MKVSSSLACLPRKRKAIGHWPRTAFPGHWPCSTTPAVRFGSLSAMHALPLPSPSLPNASTHSSPPPSLPPQTQASVSLATRLCALLLAATGALAHDKLLREERSSWGSGLGFLEPSRRSILENHPTDTDILNFALNLGGCWNSQGLPLTCLASASATASFTFSNSHT